MLWILAVHAALALAATPVVRRFGPRAFWFLALAPATTAAYALTHTGDVLRGTLHTSHTSWVPSLGLSLDFRVDSLSWMMLLVVGLVGAAVLVYCSGYFPPGSADLGKFGAVFVAFAGAMAGLVSTDNILVMFVFWELTTVFSYLLIGHYSDRQLSRHAALQAIVVTTTGGLTMLVGLVTVGMATRTWSLSELMAYPPTGHAAVIAACAILMGVITKSALFPFHFWLPGAMAAPSPVSAYLHAAAMVKAGVYVAARFAPVLATVTVWRTAILILGSVTVVWGGFRALRQQDLKLILANSTVSQVGMMVLLVGFGQRAAALAGLALLGAHALFKSSLFLVTGAIDHAYGTRDIRELNAVGKAHPWLAIAGTLATASMVGLPPFAGYVAKEAALDAWLHSPDWMGIIALIAVALGSALTVAYGLRWAWGAFATKPPEALTSTAAPHPTLPHPAASPPTASSPSPLASHPPSSSQVNAVTPHPVNPNPNLAAPPPTPHPGPLSATLTVPTLFLGAAGLVVALTPGAWERMITPYVGTYPPSPASHLTLWAGFTPALGITALAVALGLVLFALRTPILALVSRFPSVRPGGQVYRGGVRRLDTAATAITAFTQRGSLPYYLTVIFIIMVIGPGLALAHGIYTAPRTGAAASSNPVSALLNGPLSAVISWGRPAQWAAVVIIAVAAFLAARARRRLKAVLFVGVTSYGCAVLFVLHGAPDLALTQILAETLTIVVIVLVMRKLPPYFSHRPLDRTRGVRWVLAIAVGLTAMLFAVAAPLARTAPSIADAFPQAAVAGGGNNIVNVTLVDMRAWDTVGEISVLLVAATGVASLVYLRQRGRKAPRLDRAALAKARTMEAPPESDSAAAMTGRGTTRWMSAASLMDAHKRSVMFEVSARLVFPAMVVFAVFLMVRGHNAPGGGFAAGLVVGLAITVRYLAGGRFELGEAAPVHPGSVLGAGLFLAAGAGLLPLLFGGHALQAVVVDTHLPVLGDIHTSTAVFFDIGVFLVVLGLVLDVLRSLGAELDIADDESAAEEHGDGSAGTSATTARMTLGSGASSAAQPQNLTKEVTR
ncbi:MAG: Na+/H+ antiporter subunit A [Cellulomonadaceae bacterium]|nr:Na+/H+ antiporter subunit A [Cellulomonadaceae bacterium]